MAYRSLAILSALVSVVLAQSTNSLIPASISTGCAAYLSNLNTNTQIQSCLSPITTALAPFSPTNNLTSCSSSTVNTALGSLCSSTTCSQSIFTSQLGAFYANCTAELTSSPNSQVKLIYDAIYALVPFWEAMCSKDDNGDYCATKLPNSSTSGLTSGSPLYVSTDLSRRDSNSTNSTSTPILVPNPTTFQDENIAFMLLQPSMPASDLCSSCSRSILTAYITFESVALYASGLRNSTLLAGQTDLYNNITSLCGPNFLIGAVAAAGGLSQGVVGAASRIGVQELSTAVGAILGVAGLVAASL